jgi:hypothetical protein
MIVSLSTTPRVARQCGAHLATRRCGSIGTHPIRSRAQLRLVLVARFASARARAAGAAQFASASAAPAPSPRCVRDHAELDIAARPPRATSICAICRLAEPPAPPKPKIS